MNKVTKKEFREYERIRLSGLTNMFMVKEVKMLSCGILNKEKIIYIIKQYENLCKKYPDIRKL